MTTGVRQKSSPGALGAPSGVRRERWGRYAA